MSIRYAYCAVHGPTDADEGGCLRCQKRCRQSKTRRDELIDAGLCLNGAGHGIATRNLRCDWCHSVYRLGIKATLADPNHPPRPVSKRNPRSA